MPAPAAYLIISERMEHGHVHRSRALNRACVPPRHRRRVVGPHVLKYPTTCQEYLLAKGSMRAAPRPPKPPAPMLRLCAAGADLGGTDDDRRHKNAKLERGILVPRQAHAPPLDRIRHSRGRARREHAGAGAVAGRLRPGDEALQDRHAAAALRRGRRRRQDGARRHADGSRSHQQVRRHQRPAHRAHRRRL